MPGGFRLDVEEYGKNQRFIQVFWPQLDKEAAELAALLCACFALLKYLPGDHVCFGRIFVNSITYFHEGDAVID